MTEKENIITTNQTQNTRTAQHEKIIAAVTPLTSLMYQNKRLEYPVTVPIDDWFKHEWEIGQRLIRHLLADLTCSPSAELQNGSTGFSLRRELDYRAGLLGISAAWLRVYEPDLFDRPEQVYPALTAGAGVAGLDALALRRLFITPESETGQRVLSQFEKVGVILEHNRLDNHAQTVTGTSVELLRNMTAAFYYGAAFWQGWDRSAHYIDSLYVDSDAIPALVHICGGESETMDLKPEKRIWLATFSCQDSALDFCAAVQHYCDVSTELLNPNAFRGRSFVKVTCYA